MLSGKRIVVTGAYQGIGKETVRVLAETGADIVACSYVDDEPFASYCKELSEKNGVEIETVFFDMLDDDAVKNAAKSIISAKKDIDGLINIAGISKDALLPMMNIDDLKYTFQINFFSQIMFSQTISRWMQRKKTQGSIVFTSSMTALIGASGQTSYGSSKAALIGAMRCMAIELGKDGIRVNAVAPGVIKTPMTDALPEEFTMDNIKKMDIPRIGQPEDVANMFAFLMSDMSSHITGQVLQVNGGMY